MEDAQHTVTILPQNVRVTVPAGTLLLDAIQQAGIETDVPCGGQGRCGRCLARTEKGEVWRRPNAHLASAQVALGWALSCQTEVRGDVVAFLPPEKVKQEVVVASAARIPTSTRTGPPEDPVISQHYLELTAPSLQDNASDLERMLTALANGRGIKNVSISLPVLKEMERALREGDWRVTAVVEHAPNGGQPRLVAVRPGDAGDASLGAAIDIGTTTVAVVLVDMRTGRIVDSATSFNKQISCGEDVISRIIYSQKGDGLKHLQRLVRETINGLLGELCACHDLDTKRIDHLVVAGNTTMAHIFLGLNPQTIRSEPYAPLATRFPQASALELGLRANPNASVYCVPAVAAYVGGDITAGILSSGLNECTGTALFMDVGTNGEMVLGNGEWMATCACSAGPAFEGAGVECGMRATTGAIEDVHINYKTLEPTLDIIGGGPPMGVCGSGMIAALAELLVTGLVDRGGRINRSHPVARQSQRGRIVSTDHGPAYVLAWAEDSGTGKDIVLTEVDINNLIRTKGAIYAGTLVMMRALGIEPAELEKVLIGGAFGQHIDVEKSILIGLLPDLPWDRFHFLGNTSAQGAYHALVSKGARQKIEEIASKATYVELVADNSFMNEFTSTLFLPHTDIDTFPSVKQLLAELSSNGAGPVQSREKVVGP